MNRNKSNLKNMIIIVFILVLLILIVSGIISYIKYRNYKKENNYELLNVENEFVQNLFYSIRDNSSFSLFYGTTYENIYYMNDELKVDTMDENLKMLLSYMNIDTSLVFYSDNITSFKASDLKNKYFELFGNIDNYQDKDISYSCPSIIEYNNATAMYQYEGGCGNMIIRGYKNNLIEARQYTDRIEIYEKIYFYQYDEMTDATVYYKDANFQDVLSFDNQETILNEDLQIYKYTFLKKGNNYYFDRVERQ